MFEELKKPPKKIEEDDESLEIRAGGNQPSYNDYKSEIYTDIERMQRSMRDFTVDIEERLGEAHGDMSKSRMGIEFDAVSEANSFME